MRHNYLFAILAIAFCLLLTGGSLTLEANHGSERRAAELYTKYCVTCHGKDGRAKTAKSRLNPARDFTDREWQDSVSDERLFNSIMNGKRKMPGFSKKLSEKEVEALVSYVRSLKRK